MFTNIHAEDTDHDRFFNTVDGVFSIPPGTPCEILVCKYHKPDSNGDSDKTMIGCMEIRG